jgi:hypothetical protein
MWNSVVFAGQPHALLTCGSGPGFVSAGSNSLRAAPHGPGPRLPELMIQSDTIQRAFHQ